MAQNGTRATGPRCIALVGPFQSGKTTLLEAILARTGAIQRQGTVDAGTTVGDASKEARHHQMSVELSVATTNFMGESFTFVDCPGSVEFIHDMRAALPAVDAAVVVCEMDEKKIPQLQLILRELEDQKIPRFLFLNKIDKADSTIHDVLTLLQPASRSKLLLRQIPTFNGDIVTGFVDLALERAFVYKEHAASEVVPLEGDIVDREKTARFSMLETLADHDDELMEQLLGDIEPPKDKVFDDLAKELRDSLVCPVLMGSATRTNGVLRLMKALRHEAPDVATTVKRLGVKAGNDPLAYVFKTLHTAHGGKMSVARVLNGQIARRHDLPDARARGRPRRRRVQAPGPDHREARPRRRRRNRRARQARPCHDRRHHHRRQAGACGAARRSRRCRRCSRSRSPPRSARTTSSSARRCTSCWKKILRSPWSTTPRRTRSWSGARARCICGSRPSGWPIASASPSRPASPASAIARPSRSRSSSAAVTRSNPAVTASTATSSSTSSRCRAAPASRSRRRSRAAWCRATTSRRWRKACSDALKHGPLGFPVVDVAVKLIDGSYHTVDSSDMAFQLAGRLAMNEGLPQCQPVLLEPIYQVDIVCPSEATAKMNALMSGHRGQILGFDTREGWDGWDIVKVQMPEAEIGNLIIEVRSATAGVGSFTFKFDHMAELTGRTADQIIAARKAARGGVSAPANPSRETRPGALLRAFLRPRLPFANHVARFHADAIGFRAAR